MFGKRIAVVAAAAGVAVALLIGGASVAVGGTGGATTPGCSVEFRNSTSLDYAWSTYKSGSCGPLQVRHQYVTGGGSHWTSWRDWRSPTAAELTKSRHSLTYQSIRYEYEVGP
jgi:hypothetical protein